MNSSVPSDSEPSDSESFVPTLVPWKTILSPALRFKFFLTGVVFPIVCFLFIWLTDDGPAISSPWQSGDLDDYLAVLLDNPTVFFFTPLLVFNISCLSVWCFRPKLSSAILIRIGLVSGMLMSLMFVLLLLPVVAIFSQLSAIVLGPVLALFVWLGQRLIVRAKRFTIMHLIIATTVVAIPLALIPFSQLSFTDALIRSFSFPLILVLSAAPTLCCLTYLRTAYAARALAARSETHASMPFSVTGWLVWLSGFAVSWKLALDSMLVEYAKLPTGPTNCFISSAAAHGHKPWVRSSQPLEGGSPVNLQMRRLKFLELGLAAGFPRAHQLIRNCYNRIGPPLAAGCRISAWIADVAYLFLKPIEWLALVFQRLIRIPDSRIDELYK